VGLDPYFWAPDRMTGVTNALVIVTGRKRGANDAEL